MGRFLPNVTAENNAFIFFSKNVSAARKSDVETWRKTTLLRKIIIICGGTLYKCGI